MSNSEKKMLANQIKTDLKKDLDQSKKSDRETPSTYFKSLGECGDCQGERLNFAGVGSADYLEQNIKRRKGDIFPNELESTDWEEIVNLLNQIDKLNNEKREWDKKEHENKKAKIDQKLKSNQKIFYYEYLDELWDAPDEVYHFFLGCGEDGKEFHLMVPENHPVIDNLPRHEEFPKRKKEKILCLIEGAENIPYTQHPKIKNRNGFLKWVKLEDKISITPVHDEGGLNQESRKNENSDPDLEQNNNKNLQGLVKNPNERANIDSLLGYFKIKGIKQITLTPEGSLTIKYNSTMFLNDKNDNELIDQTIINSDKLSQELQEVKNYLQSNQKQSLSKQELMSIINSTSISPENDQDNSGLKMGLAWGIGGTLLVGIMIGLLVKKKTTQKLKYK